MTNYFAPPYRKYGTSHASYFTMARTSRNPWPGCHVKIVKASNAAIKIRIWWPDYSDGSKGGSRDAPPWGSKFFQFHAIFEKIWQNRMLVPPRSWRPLLGEILDPPLWKLSFQDWHILLHVVFFGQIPATYIFLEKNENMFHNLIQFFLSC